MVRGFVEICISVRLPWLGNYRDSLFEMLSETCPDGAAADHGTFNFFEIYLINVSGDHVKKGIGTKMVKR